LLVVHGLTGIDRAQSATADEGVVTVPAMTIPYSDLASPEAKRNFIAMLHQRRQSRAWSSNDIRTVRSATNLEKQASVTLLRRKFPVIISSEIIGGVHSEVIVPASGIPERNTARVLINLHGGSMLVGAGNAAQEASIPISSLGRIKVVTVDYRMAPESHFPAASEDVANVYAELLKSYHAENIGIYGCSSGAVLAAQAVAWFRTRGLPRPGAIGLFGEGAMDDGRLGDSLYTATLGGNPAPTPPSKQSRAADEARHDWIYAGSTDATGPLISPAYHPEVLKDFPPSLLISGTRDLGLSKIVYTHAQLVEAGVEADLHVWEGATHCSYADGLVDPDVPENLQAWKVISRFFDTHLGNATQ